MLLCCPVPECLAKMASKDVTMEEAEPEMKQSSPENPSSGEVFQDETKTAENSQGVSGDENQGNGIGSGEEYDSTAPGNTQHDDLFAAEIEDDDDMKDLFGSDEEEEGEAEKFDAKSSQGEGVDDDDLFGASDEGEDGAAAKEEQIPEQEVHRVTQQYVYHPPANSRLLYLERLPTSLKVENDPYDEGFYEEDPNVGDDIVRYRCIEQPDGEIKVESNAKIVKWPDGSMHLYIGNRVVRTLQEFKDDATAQDYLYIRTGMYLEAIGKLKKCVMNPPLLQKMRVKRQVSMGDRAPTIMGAFSRRGQKKMKVKIIAEDEDMAKARREKDAQLDDELRRRKIDDQAKWRQQRSQPSLTSDYLEEDSSEEDEDDDDYSTKGRRRKDSPLSRRHHEDGEMQEIEEAKYSSSSSKRKLDEVAEDVLDTKDMEAIEKELALDSSKKKKRRLLLDDEEE